MADLINNQKVRQFSRLELFARQVVEGFITGLHKSPFHGFSVEFAEHRLYNTGESTRHIDWKLFARTDKYFVKRYEEETNLRCQIVIDTSSSMYYPEGAKPNKITFSIHAAAALTHLFRTQRDAVGLAFFDETINTFLPARLNTSHLLRIYRELENLEEKPAVRAKTSAASALDEIAERIHKRSVVVIFSDMMENGPEARQAMFRALQHLKYNKHEVILFHVVDRKTEIDFDFDNRPYTFEDMETGERIKLNPGAIRDQYRQYSDKFEKEIKLKCHQYGIDFIAADIAKGFEQVLMAYLVKRSRIK